MAIKKSLVWISIFSAASWAHAEEFAAVLERELQAAKRSQVELQGYPEPTNYVVKSANLPKREAKTTRTLQCIETLIDVGISAAALPSYIHHEYAHACQMMLGGPSRSVFMDEASATLQEMYAFGDNGTWQSAAAQFQESPQIPPLVDVRELSHMLSATSKFEYGGGLFLQFLDQRFGEDDGQWLHQIWRSAQSRLPQIGNAEWLEIIEAHSGSAFEDVVLEFANWRLDKGWIRTLTIASQNGGEIFLASAMRPLPFGCVMLRFPASQAERSFSLAIETQTPMGLAWNSTVQTGLLKFAQGENTPSWITKRNENLFVSVCNLDKEAFLRRDWMPPMLKIILSTPKG